MSISKDYSAYEGEFFLESEIGRPAAEDSRFHVIPFPFEASVSYAGGASGGPQAILDASQQLELYDGQGMPGEAGIFTHPPLELYGPAEDGPVEELFGRARRLSERLIRAGHMPVFLGGEHSISYGPIMGARDVYGDDLGIIQIDAHADLRLAYQGRVWSHASVMRRCTDEGIHLYQLGIRALCREEAEYRAAAPHIHSIDARNLVPRGIMSLELPKDFPAQIYLTVDVDGLDPSIMPSTGTPVPGGLGWYQTLSLIESVLGQRKLAAFDVVELAPRAGDHGPDFLAAQLAYAIMGMALRA